MNYSKYFPQEAFPFPCSVCHKCPISRQCYVCLRCPSRFVTCVKCYRKKHRPLADVQDDFTKTSNTFLVSKELNNPQLDAAPVAGSSCHNMGASCKHSRKHPMQLLLSQSMWKAYYLFEFKTRFSTTDPLKKLGLKETKIVQEDVKENETDCVPSLKRVIDDKLFIGQPQSLTCPLCGLLGQSLPDYSYHTRFTCPFLTSPKHRRALKKITHITCAACLQKIDSPQAVKSHKCPIENLKTTREYQLYLANLAESWHVVQKSSPDVSSTSTSVSTNDGTKVQVESTATDNAASMPSTTWTTLPSETTSTRNGSLLFTFAGQTLESGKEICPYSVRAAPAAVPNATMLQGTSANTLPSNDIHSLTPLEKSVIPQLLLSTAKQLCLHLPHSTTMSYILNYLDSLRESEEFKWEFSSASNQRALDSLRRTILALDGNGYKKFQRSFERSRRMQ